MPDREYLVDVDLTEVAHSALDQAVAEAFAKGWTEGLTIASVTDGRVLTEDVGSISDAFSLDEAEDEDNLVDAIAIDALFENVQALAKRLESLEKTLNLEYTPDKTEQSL